MLIGQKNGLLLSSTRQHAQEIGILANFDISLKYIQQKTIFRTLLCSFVSFKKLLLVNDIGVSDSLQLDLLTVRVRKRDLWKYEGSKI